MSRVQNELQNLAGKITQGEMAVSRIEDALLTLRRRVPASASTQVRTQASIAILAQAKQLNVESI